MKRTEKIYSVSFQCIERLLPDIMRIIGQYSGHIGAVTDLDARHHSDREISEESYKDLMSGRQWWSRELHISIGPERHGDGSPVTMVKHWVRPVPRRAAALPPPAWTSAHEPKAKS